MTANNPPVPPRDPSDPFAQLERCHRRLEEACDALSIAGSDRNAETVFDVLSFFARQIKRHEEDEEQSLFPRCGARADLKPILERLSVEHREHETLHAELERLVRATDLDEDARWSSIEAVSEKIARAYRVHIEEEEKELFPNARTHLSDDEKRAMVDEMAARRARRPRE